MRIVNRRKPPLPAIIFYRPNVVDLFFKLKNFEAQLRREYAGAFFSSIAIPCQDTLFTNRKSVRRTTDRSSPIARRDVARSHLHRTYAKLSQQGAPTQTVQSSTARATPLERFCVSPITADFDQGSSLLNTSRSHRATGKRTASNLEQPH